ncbi:MAG: hypothetical protein LBC74_15475 [Planctomycetaceae bacterium]|nr:hypothetical protein [Planctomycetaceae bacterium]
MPPKEANKKTHPREANYFPPSEGAGVVSYWLAKRSNHHTLKFVFIFRQQFFRNCNWIFSGSDRRK